MPKANLMLYNLPQFKNLLIKKKKAKCVVNL